MTSTSRNAPGSENWHSMSLNDQLCEARELASESDSDRYFRMFTEQAGTLPRGCKTPVTLGHKILGLHCPLDDSHDPVEEPPEVFFLERMVTPFIPVRSDKMNCDPLELPKFINKPQHI